jgi:hypothetical protein
MVANLKQSLSFTLAERVRTWYTVNPRFGVNIAQPAAERSVPGSFERRIGCHNNWWRRRGPYAAFFEQFSDQNQAKAFIALVIQIASAVAKNGQSPDNIFPNTNDFFAGAGVGKSNNGPNGPVHQKIQRTPQSGNPQSLAGD